MTLLKKHQSKFCSIHFSVDYSRLILWKFTVTLSHASIRFQKSPF